MEPKADYLTRQRMADDANREAARAREAIRFEAAMVKETANVILRALDGWNKSQHLSESVLRCAMIQAYERLGEVTGE